MSTVLLVENDPLQAFLCKSILERRFRDVRRVGDAAEALCLVEQPSFADSLDLIVSNQNLPGIGNQQFVAELHERLPKVPVLVLGKAESRTQQSTATPGQPSANPTAANSWLRFVSRPLAGDEILAVAGELLSQN